MIGPTLSYFSRKLGVIVTIEIVCSSTGSYWLLECIIVWFWPWDILKLALADDNGQDQQVQKAGKLSWDAENKEWNNYLVGRISLEFSIVSSTHNRISRCRPEVLCFSQVKMAPERFFLCLQFTQYVEFEDLK